MGSRCRTRSLTTQSSAKTGQSITLRPCPRLEFDDDGSADEACGKTLAGKLTPVIVEWERGDFADELVEVSHEQAERIIQYFRERWGPHGQ